MELRVTLNYFRVSPKKVRLLTNLLRGLSVAQAESQLSVAEKSSAEALRKLLKSAIANAKHNHQLDEADLFIKECLTNEGPKLKRYAPKAYGRAGLIRKRSSRVTLVLATRPRAAATTSAKPVVRPAKTGSLAGESPKGVTS